MVTDTYVLDGAHQRKIFFYKSDIFQEAVLEDNATIELEELPCRIRLVSLLILTKQNATIMTM